ncbi:MAG TPA: alpha/beta hydrolase-fold protein [Thermomicrobiales bacterium]|jgi:S-formylglutathione hydrolase FrmB
MRLSLISALLLVTSLLIIPLTAISSAMPPKQTETIPMATASPLAKSTFNAMLPTAPLASTIATATAASTAPEDTTTILTFVHSEPRTVMASLDTAPLVTPTSPSRVEERFFASATLGRPVHYYVYLPAGYDDDPAVRYPTLYLLHGIGGNADEWLGYGVREAADSLMGNGAIHPFIIALPHGEQGYWVDQVAGGPQWATYVADDVVPDIDQHYRTLPERDDRAIGGLSMGAHGALQIALNHPDTFGIVGAHSPSFRPRAEVPTYFGDDADFAQRDPTQLVADRPEIARTLTIWLDFGFQDGFRAGQLLFEQALVDNDIPHEFHEGPGDHSNIYWTAHLGEYLRFYDASFAAFAAP